MTRANRYSPEVQERAARMVHEQESAHSSRWSAIVSIAEKIGCTPETPRKWVQRSEIDSGHRAGMTSTDLEELKALRRENRELKRANEILKSASAFFAQAELDRRLK